MAVKNRDIARIIRAHRKKSGLTQKELADIANIGKTTLFDIEKGKDSVQLISLLKVIEALNLSLSLHSPCDEAELMTRGGA